MKKLTILGVVLILLAVSVVPVMAAGNSPNGHGNGHGNGVSAGQPNNGGAGDQIRDRDQTRQNNPGRGANRSTVTTQNGNRMRTPFYLQGTITIVDTTTLKITVSVAHGNSQVKQYINNPSTPIILQASGTTKYFMITQGVDDENEGTSSTVGTNADEDTNGNKTSVAITDLKPGQYVAIHGNVVNGVFTVRLVTVYDRTPIGETAGNP